MHLTAKLRPHSPDPIGPNPRLRHATTLKVYKSADGIEIFVGRGARDNDELSISSARECPREWWMHAAGCPGSHVVIKCDDDEPPRPTVLDAAALAAKYSKAAGNRVSVSLTRCRNVSKPRGAKVRFSRNHRATNIRRNGNGTETERKRNGNGSSCSTGRRSRWTESMDAA